MCTALLCLDAAAAAAQGTSPDAPDPANVRVRIGPVLLNPTIAITNAGVDDNVFNDPASNVPKEDFTLTITPATDLWLPIGPTWVTANIKEEINWFQQYASERSANTSYALGWRVPLSRVTFKLGTLFAYTRDRPGYEIDARALHTQFGHSLSADYRALSRTFIGVTWTRDRTGFDEGATFAGANLHDELNRISSSYGVTLREQLTVLTAVTFAATHAQDRFEFSPDRDTDANSGTVTVSFDPQALLKGSAAFGYTDFKPQDPALPGYQGFTTNVGLSYTLLESTRFTFSANRSVQYSYDNNQPYYLLTGYNFSVAQQIFGPVDLVGRIGHETLAYRDRAGVPIEAPNRSDEVFTYGGGVGYHLGKSLRLGFNIDRSRRTSPIESRTYEGLRYGTALTYGT